MMWSQNLATEALHCVKKIIIAMLLIFIIAWQPIVGNSNTLKYLGEERAHIVARTEITTNNWNTGEW